MTKPAKGYKCECGKFNEFHAWVYAHWNELITHHCECGRKNYLCEGDVARTMKPRKQPATPSGKGTSE